MSQPPRKVIHLPKVRMLSRGGRLSSGVRITNVKSVRPPNPVAVKKQEEEKLRAQRGRRSTATVTVRDMDSEPLAASEQPAAPHTAKTRVLVRPKNTRFSLQKEIVSRSRTCAYKSYECPLPVVSGRQFCYRHITRDPTAPFRQCAHAYANGERCPMPAPSDSRDHRDPGLCFEHARAALYARQRSAAPPPPVTTTETLLNQLQHYVKPERPRTTSCASSVSVVSDPAEQEPIDPETVDPFKQIDATAINTAYATAMMECASCSDSDGESITLGPGGDCRAGDHEDLSDAEDAPCEEMPLWRAGVYTAEEAVLVAKTALQLLQSAYIKQMGRLRVLLHTARALFLRELKAEREQYCSINAQSRSGPMTARERRQLRKLKAYASYHKKLGNEAVLARKLHHKRAKLNAPCPNRPIPSQGRCTFTEGGVRCPAHVLPAAKHCLKHILHDRHQVLFNACGDIRGVTSCREPIPKLPLPSSACRYHTDPPVYTVFTLKKDGSDSESESPSTSDDSHIEELGEMSADDRLEIQELQEMRELQEIEEMQEIQELEEIQEIQEMQELQEIQEVQEDSQELGAELPLLMPSDLTDE